VIIWIKPGVAGERPVANVALQRGHVAGIMTTLWLVAVTGLALIETRVHWASLLAQVRLHPERQESLFVALATVGMALLLSLVAGMLRPARFRLTILALALIPVPILVTTSGNIRAGLVTVGMLVPVLWLGREIATRTLGLDDASEAWIVGSGLGVAGLAALGYALLLGGVLLPQVIASLLILVTLVLLWSARKRLRRDAADFVRWLHEPAARRPGDFAAAGLLLGFYWLAQIGALAPEMMADAIRQRIPAAALYAREGRFVVDPDLYVTASPGMGESLYATVLAIGPLETTKIVNLIVGLLCTAAVWNLGRLLGSERAGLFAALAFATLPLTTFLEQVAYLDLFPTLFAITAAALLMRQERLDARMIVVALACIAVGWSVKTSFMLTAAGLAVTMGLLVLRRLSVRAARIGTGAALLALLAGVVWVTNSFAVLSRVPSLAPAVAILSRARDEHVGTLPELGENGVGRSLADLARLPLDLVLHTRLYGEFLDGFAGYLLLALIPLILVVRPGRRMTALLIGVGTAGLLWFAVAQYLRYALPMLALLAAAGAASFAGLMERSVGPAKSVMLAAPPVLAGLGLIGYLNTVLVYPGIVPYRVVLGMESKSAYLTEHVDAYTALRLLNEEPGATLAAAGHEYGRLYSNVRLSNISYSATQQNSDRDEAGVLAYFDREGYSHIVIDRDILPSNWDSIVALNEEFLRRNTVLVGGDHNAYLYRLLPPDQRGQEQPWARGPELVPNGGFEEENGALPPGWSATGEPVLDASGQGYRTTQMAARIGEGSAFFTTVPVAPGAQYLLSHATRSTEDYGFARLQINWMTEAGTLADVSIEVVPVSPRDYHRFSMLTTAPADAKTATIYVHAQKGEVLFDDVSLRSVEAHP
jgi:hypothetical protein